MKRAAIALLTVLGAPVAAESAAEPVVRSHPLLTSHSQADLADRARSAVLHVRGVIVDRTPRAGGHPPSGITYSVGSGFLVDRVGLVVTNEHVIRGTVDLRVRLYDGREFHACVLGADEVADIALLKIDLHNGVLPVLPLGNSDKVRSGEAVVAIGSPFGFAHSVTAGIVSATERVVESGSEKSNADPDDPPYAFYIQTDASINVGNSGGPLLDSAGTVIGVNAAFWGGAQPANGVGFAIPINVVKLLLPHLRTTGEPPRSFVGVESQPLTPDLATAFHVPGSRGALIAAIEPGSPAEAAGLQVGDVVTSWGTHLLATRDDFRIFAQLTSPGTRVHMGILRDGKAIERIIAPRAGSHPSRPRPLADCRAPNEANAAGLGLEVRDIPGLRTMEEGGARGAQVSKVTGGVARDANLQVGDIVLRAGGAPVTGADNLRKQLAAWKQDAPLPLLIRTRSRTFWTALPRR